MLGWCRSLYKAGEEQAAAAMLPIGGAGLRRADEPGAMLPIVDATPPQQAPEQQPARQARRQRSGASEAESERLAKVARTAEAAAEEAGGWCRRGRGRGRGRGRRCSSSGGRGSGRGGGGGE